MERRHRRLGLALALAAAAAWLVPAAFAAERQPVQIRVQLKWFHQFQFAGYYAAVEQGYFRDAGLNVTLLQGGPSVNPTDVVLSGGAEFGIATSGLIASRSRGRPVVAVAAIFQHSPYILLARDDPAIHSVRDLAGRRVMMEPYSEELIAFLHHEGTSIDDIVPVEHGGDPLVLAGGDIAAMTAYTTTEPHILDRAGVAYRTFDPKLAGIDFYGDTLFTSEEFARRNEATVVAFRDALIEGWRYALRHREEIADLIHAKYGSELTREHESIAADEIRRLLIPDLVEIGYMNRARWEHIAAEFQAAGLMRGPVDMDEFLFQPTVRTDWTWVYATLLGAAALLALIGLALLKFYRLSRNLKAQIRARLELENELKALAVTDPGTGVLNRRGFFAALAREFGRSAAVPPVLLIIDLDHFKRINDTHGHAAGDRVLTEVTRVCRETLRGQDEIARLGGEEFAALLKDTGAETARRLAERIRETVAGTRIRLPKGQEIGVTVSIGLAVRQGGEAPDALISRADGAMYEAKCLGRNRVVEAADAGQTARLMMTREKHGLRIRASGTEA